MTRCRLPAALLTTWLLALLAGRGVSAEALVSLESVLAAPGQSVVLRARLQASPALRSLRAGLRVAPRNASFPPLTLGHPAVPEAVGPEVRLVVDRSAPEPRVLLLGPEEGIPAGTEVEIPVAVPLDAPEGAVYDLSVEPLHALDVTQATVPVLSEPGSLTVGFLGRSAAVEAPQTAAPAGVEVLVPVMASDLRGVASGVLSVSAAAPAGSGASPLAFGAPSPGELQPAAALAALPADPGTARVGLTSSVPISGSGVLLYLPVTVPTGTATGISYRLEVSATFLDAEGRAMSVVSRPGALTVARSEARVAALRLTPAAGAVPVGGTLPFTAAALDARGQVVPEVRVDWSVEPAGGSAAVSSAGELTGLSPGDVVLRASVGGVAADAPVTVTPELAGISVELRDLVVRPGERVEMPVYLSAAEALGVDFLLTAEGEGLPPIGFERPVTTGTLAANGFADANLTQPGAARVGILASDAPVRGPGTLVRVPVQVPEGVPHGSVYQMRLSGVELFDEQGLPVPGVTAEGGRFTVAADTEAPAVEITSPGPGSQVAGIAAFEVAASDGAGMLAHVGLYVDGSAVPAARTGESPAVLSLDTRNLSGGLHHVVARALDASGNAAVSAPLVVRVSNSPLPLLAPSLREGAAFSGLVSLPLPTPNPGALTRAELVLEPSGQRLAEAAEAPFVLRLDTTALPDGLRDLRLRAVDAAGVAAERTVRIEVDNTPPEARVLTPQPSDTLRGLTTLEADVSDAGSGAAYFMLEALADGQTGPAVAVAEGPLPAGAGSVVLEWDSSRLPTGGALLRITVLDRAGNHAFVETPVTVAPPFAPGDLTGDDLVSVADVLRALNIALRRVTPTRDELAAGDLDGDGVIAIGDVIRVLRRALGIE